MTTLGRHSCIALAAVICALGMRAYPASASFVGAWRFVKEVDRRPDGSIVQIGPARGYSGLLIFTDGGIVSGQIYPVGRTWKPASATREDFQSTVNLSSAAFGRYQVDLVRKQLVLTLEGSLDPTQEGATNVRDFKFVGDTLILSGPFDYNGQQLRFDITWTRQNRP